MTEQLLSTCSWQHQGTRARGHESGWHEGTGTSMRTNRPEGRFQAAVLIVVAH